MPPKIRNFIWCACCNVLPTHSKLFDKQISSTVSCHWCEEEVETCDHVLWQCEFAQRVWAAGAVQMPARLELQMTFVEVVEACLRDLTSPNVELFFSTAWFLWGECFCDSATWRAEGDHNADLSLEKG